MVKSTQISQSSSSSTSSVVIQDGNSMAAILSHISSFISSNNGSPNSNNSSESDTDDASGGDILMRTSMASSSSADRLGSNGERSLDARKRQLVLRRGPRESHSNDNSKLDSNQCGDAAFASSVKQQKRAPLRFAPDEEEKENIHTTSKRRNASSSSSTTSTSSSRINTKISSSLSSSSSRNSLYKSEGLQKSHRMRQMNVLRDVIEMASLTQQMRGTSLFGSHLALGGKQMDTAEDDV